MRIAASGIAAVTLLILSGCGSETGPPAQTSTAGQEWLSAALTSPEYRMACEATPGCETEIAADVASEAVWRVRITRADDHHYTLDQLERLQVQEGDGVPLGALYGDIALVGLDSDGEILDGQLLHFPPPDDKVPDALQHRHLHNTGDVAVVYGFIRALPDIRTLAVQNRSGIRHAALEVAANRDSAALDRWLRWAGINQAWALNRPFGGLPPHCAHIIVLQGEEDRHLAGGIPFGENVRLTAPGPYQLAAMQAALSKMTPLLCQSIARIAVGLIRSPKAPGGAVNSFGAGDLVLINVDHSMSEENLESLLSPRLELQATLIHEAAHTAETLLTVESASPGDYRGAWGFPSRTLANKTIDKVRLEKGLPGEWQRMHRSFRRHGWARQHQNSPFLAEEAMADWNRANFVHAGFISRYAAANWAEDIADHVAHAYMSRPTHEAHAAHNVPEDQRQDYGCLEMRRYSERNLPAQFAAVYTKLYFLRDLGLVRREDVEWCTGDALGLHVERPGFHVWQDGELRRSYDTAVTAHLGTRENGVKVFELQAKGEAGFGGSTYPARVHLRLAIDLPATDIERVSWPRGMYELGLKSDNNFWIRLDGAAAGNFDVMDGFVLVAESSSERIVGSIVIQRVFRLQAPLPVPERYDPPLVVRFRIDGSGA